MIVRSDAQIQDNSLYMRWFKRPVQPKSKSIIFLDGVMACWYKDVCFCWCADPFYRAPSGTR